MESGPFALTFSTNVTIFGKPTLGLEFFRIRAPGILVSAETVAGPKDNITLFDRSTIGQHIVV